MPALLVAFPSGLHQMPEVPVMDVVLNSAAAVLLLGGVIAAAQWVLRRVYGESEETGHSASEDHSCHQPR